MQAQSEVVGERYLGMNELLLLRATEAIPTLRLYVIAKFYITSRQRRG